MKTDELNKFLSGRKILIPVLLGLSVTLFYVFYDFSFSELTKIEWTGSLFFWLFMAVLMVVIRDLGYVLRLRILSDKILSWKQSFQITMLWEFSSAISPGALGGTAVAFVLMAQEKISTGKSTAIVLVTSFLDVLYYIILVPLVFLTIGLSQVFPSEVNGMFSSSGLQIYFWVGYLILFIWTSTIFIGLFIKPQIIGQLIIRIFKLKILKKWKQKSFEWAKDLEIASEAFKQKPLLFWIKGFGVTFLSWTARFFMVNCLIMAFGNSMDHFLVYGRQLVMWVILMVPFTPGASGIAEAVFPAFLGVFFANTTLSKTSMIIWRLLSYYPYLIIGSIILPIWLKRIRSTGGTKLKVK